MKLIKKILFFIFLLTSLLSPAKSHKDKMLKKVFPTLASTMKIQIITKDTLFYNNKWELTTKEDAEFFRPLNFEKKKGDY
ncbi:hypothetical protein, partial [Cellulophaga sp. Z1A5H]|uniref:hypothetical protein n=1 Tax=Cellulophaga sp. Z1A5H TaxID=2687291 RepID=UPI00196B732C